MISLLIDTSSSNLLVSVIRNNDILAFSKMENCIGHSTKLLVEIDICLEKAKLSISDIDTIFIVNGPGSFTGLRVGVTVAKTLAYSLKNKIIPISSLELMATTPFFGDYIVPYIDARRGYVYAGIYDKNLNVYKEDSYISVDNLLSSLPCEGTTVFTGYTEVNGIPNKIIPVENTLQIVQKYEQMAGTHPHQVNPNYLKLTEAEEKQKND